MTALRRRPALAGSVVALDELTGSGFAVVPAVLDAPRIERVRRLVGRVYGEERLGACVRPNNVLVPLRWNDGLVDYLLSIPEVVTSIRQAAAARDLRWISGYVSIREPHTGPLPWHQDWWCWQHPISYQEAAAQVAVACYLDDLREDNAALAVVPGSHRDIRRYAEVIDDDGVLAGEPAGSRVVEVHAGDMVVMDYRLLHGTTANRSAERRAAVLLNFAPDWAGLPDDLCAHLISHLALPSRDEPVPEAAWHGELLPAYDGAPADLPLVRSPLLQRLPSWLGVDRTLRGP